MNTFKRGYFDAPVGQVHFRMAGPGGRPLVLLHQSPLSSTQFDAVLPGLAARGFHALALDMPGFGMSDPAGEGATLEDYAAIIPAALGEMGWDGASMVGHHTGAVVEREHFATFYFGPKEPRADGSHLLTAWQNRLRSTPGWSDIRLMHRYTVEALFRGDTNWKAFPLVLGADLEAVLRELQVETLLLTNTGEDLYEATQRSRDLRPGFFAYRELAGGSHDIIDEQPGPWTRTVADFLEHGAAAGT
jgi:hypothetical protein